MQAGIAACPLTLKITHFCTPRAGMCYLLGHSQDQSFKQAASLLTIASNQGHPRAQYELALLYFAGNGVPRQDEIQACALLAKSSQSGFADAMLKVGVTPLLCGAPVPSCNRVPPSIHPSVHPYHDEGL